MTDSCDDGYIGRFCEVASACFGVAGCNGHGVCSSPDGGMKRCDCVDGYTGAQCEHDACHGVECGRWGACETELSRYSGSSAGAVAACRCYGDWHGEHCELSPCEEGQGAVGVAPHTVCGEHGACNSSGVSRYCTCR